MEHTDHIQNNLNEMYGLSTERPNLLAARAFDQLEKYDFKKNVSIFKFKVWIENVINWDKIE